jgi:hypothetical protein
VVCHHQTRLEGSGNVAHQTLGQWTVSEIINRRLPSVFLPGSYVNRQYTIVNSATAVSGTFNLIVTWRISSPP